jgi:hypothetical protein
VRGEAHLIQLIVGVCSAARRSATDATVRRPNTTMYRGVKENALLAEDGYQE